MATQSGHLAGSAAQAPGANPDVAAPTNPAAGTSVSIAPAAPSGASGASAAVDPIAEAPQLQWYVMPPGAASQYGPAVGEEFRNWINEGRVTADTLVWRQDWPEWKAAGIVFPELQGPASAMPTVPMTAAAPPGGFALPTAAGALPTAAGPLPAAMGYLAAAEGIAGLNVGPGGFPVSAPAPASSGRRGQYRPRSNTGPIVVISILVLAMIPLSYFVVKVIRQQLASQPPAAASPKKAAE
ncbi:MAG TPA: DUF4339 domain-containing protein [Pirellulales bacterium]|nr:DUF4339 domain-containing protein [Pirellulales bacterium]